MGFGGSLTLPCIALLCIHPLRIHPVLHFIHTLGLHLASGCCGPPGQSLPGAKSACLCLWVSSSHPQKEIWLALLVRCLPFSLTPQAGELGQERGGGARAKAVPGRLPQKGLRTGEPKVSLSSSLLYGCLSWSWEATVLCHRGILSPFDRAELEALLKSKRLRSWPLTLLSQLRGYKEPFSKGRTSF